VSTSAIAHPQVSSRRRKQTARDNRRAVRFTARAGILLVMMLLVGSFAISPLRDYFGQSAQLSQLTRQVTQLQQQKAALETRIANLHDPQYLQLLARECLGLVKPGQTAFVTVPLKGSSQPADC
jgi:cell division protein FtsB